MKICLETSSISGFLKGEPDCEPIERLLTLAETGKVELFVSSFAWKEIYDPLDELGSSRRERLSQVAKRFSKVAWVRHTWKIIGLDVSGKDDFAEVERSLSQASGLDGDHFLSYAALGLNFFVTKDRGYLEEPVRSQLVKKYDFQVGTADECVDWIGQRGVY